MYAFPTAETILRYTGCVLGAACGDALAVPTAHLRWEQITREFGPYGINALEQLVGDLGAVSARTVVALAVSEGLLRSDAPLIESLTAASIADELQEWREAAAAPASPVTRGYTIGLAYAGAPALLRDLAKAQARLTTGRSPAAVVAAVIWAHAVAFVAEHPIGVEGAAPLRDYLLALRCPWSGSVKAAWDGALSDVRLAWATAEAAEGGTGGIRTALNDLGPGNTAQSAMLLALTAYFIAPDAYEIAVIGAANIDGDSATVASMVGALVGMNDFPPSRFVEHLQEHRLLAASAYGLAMINVTARASW